MSKAKLHWSKTGKGENALYTLEGFEGVIGYSYLPAEYKRHAPNFWPNGSGGIYIHWEHNKFGLYRGSVVSELTFRHITSTMKAAGRRLTEINRKLREPVRFTVEI